MKLAIPINERDHAIGPADALVTVVNYGDYECPDCRHRHLAVEKMFDQLVDSVRFVYRHFPLVNVHTHAMRAAEAAEAAAVQGKYLQCSDPRQLLQPSHQWNHRRTYDIH